MGGTPNCGAPSVVPVPSRSASKTGWFVPASFKYATVPLKVSKLSSQRSSKGLIESVLLTLS